MHVLYHDTYQGLQDIMRSLRFVSILTHPWSINMMCNTEYLHCYKHVVCSGAKQKAFGMGYAAQSCRQSFAGRRVCRGCHGFSLRVLKETPTMQVSLRT